MTAFEWFLARRYLFSREHKTLISVITLIAVLGVTVGVATLLVVSSVMDGAQDLLFNKITNLFPHVRVLTQDEREPFADAGLLAEIRADDRVARAQPMLQKFGAVQGEPGAAADKIPVTVLGLDRLGGDSIYQFDEPLRAEAVALGPGEVALGEPLARELNLAPGDTLYLLALGSIENPGSSIRMKPLTVRTVFNTGFHEFDAASIFLAEAQLRTLYRQAQGYDFIHITLHDPQHARAFADHLALPYPYVATTWVEDSGAFFNMLKLQKLMLFVILLLIILVAAFNIIGTLILMVIEKTREIGILRAMGAGDGAIARVFALNGILIGLIGTVLGVGLGLAVCAAIPLLPIEMPASIYNFDRLPVKVEPLTVAAVMASAMLICVIASLFPARQAARLKPVEALRYD